MCPQPSELTPTLTPSLLPHFPDSFYHKHASLSRTMLRILILTALLGSSVSATPRTPSITTATSQTGKVQVFILMGQSNMLGMAPLLNKEGENGLSLETVVKTNGLFPYLWDNKTSDWAVSPNVRNVGVMGR
jgi:hypothetical protein